MSAAPIRPGQTTGNVTVDVLPLKTAQISIFLYNDDSPINNQADAPNAQERGLCGFEVHLYDAGGTYGASGGIHFGVDLSAPCGTEVVAMADGIVFAVDGPFGSPPHNLVVDHPQLGYAPMYAHLLEAPNLRPGDVVKQGQVIAYTGDAGETCYSRPHLHWKYEDVPAVGRKKRVQDRGG